MADAFDLLDDAVTTDKGSITDYQTSRGELFGAGFEESFEAYNPTALLGRGMRYLDEDLKSLTGESERIDQKTAQAEIAKRGLDLKVPVGGMTRHELDTLQYLKQRELARQSTYARPRPIGGTASMLGGALAGAAVDPINVASAFIPIVPEARYAQWLARAGEGAFARAGARAGAGAIEGTVGAAIIEPIVYAGATSEQADYGLMDSFMNVTLGGVMGGGLHAFGGAVVDRVAGMPAPRDPIPALAAAAPDHVKADALHDMVAAHERGEVGDVLPIFAKQATELPPIRTTDKSVAMAGFRPALIEEFRAKFQAAQTPEQQLFALRDLKRYPESSIRKILEAIPEIEGRKSEPESVNLAAVMVGDKTYTGSTHVIALGKLSDETGEEFDSLADKVASGEIAEGFTTTAGRFVDRQEAAGIAAALKQTKSDGRADFEPSADKPLISEHTTLGARGTVDRLIKALDSSPSRQGRGLADLIPEARADRTEDAFTRQFVQDGRAPDTAKPEPKDHIARANEDEATANELVEEFRAEGRLTEDDEAALKSVDEAVKRAELKAKAFEAAAACMATT